MNESVQLDLGSRAPAAVEIIHPDQPPHEEATADRSKWPLNPFATPIREAVLKLKDSPVGDVSWRLANTGSYPFFDRILVGHLSSSPSPDVVIVLETTANGLALARGDLVVLLSKKGTYKAYHIVCWNFSAFNFVQYPDGAICLLQTALVEGETGRDGKRHNYWVHRLLRVDDGSFDEMASFGRRWIMYANAPNHRETKQLSDEQKERLWMTVEKQLSVEVLRPIG